MILKDVIVIMSKLSPTFDKFNSHRFLQDYRNACFSSQCLLYHVTTAIISFGDKCDLCRDYLFFKKKSLNQLNKIL